MYRKVHCITIHNGPKLETTEIPINARMDKYIGV